MGTSTSSKGGKTGSPFDPEWLVGDGGAGDVPNTPDAPDGDSNPNQGTEADSEGADFTSSEGDTLADGGAVAPNRRYAEARTKMSAFLSGGGRESLRSATKSMVNRGMGGPGQAASTMRRTAQGVGQLGQFLASARDRTDQKVVDWVERVRQANLSASDLVLELVKEVIPETGSIDDESLRNAAAEALGMLYELEPDVDILALTDQQIANVMAFTIANEVCNRMDLQLGQTYERLKFDPQQVQLYRQDIKEYVTAEVTVVMGRFTPNNLNPQQLARDVLASSLQVFAQ